MDAADADAVRASSKVTATVGKRFTILLTIIIVYAMLLSFQYKRGISELVNLQWHQCCNNIHCYLSRNKKDTEHEA